MYLILSKNLNMVKMERGPSGEMGYGAVLVKMGKMVNFVVCISQGKEWREGGRREE